LTLPVVIVATEKNLSRVPRSLCEASLVLGVTKAETLWRGIADGQAIHDDRPDPGGPSLKKLLIP